MYSVLYVQNKVYINLCTFICSTQRKDVKKTYDLYNEDDKSLYNFWLQLF